MVESEPPPQLLELYKLAVEMADRTSARRGLANSFFLTLGPLPPVGGCSSRDEMLKGDEGVACRPRAALK